MSIIFRLIPLLLIVSCSNNKNLPNEENSFYKRGMELRQEGRFDDAAEAFEHCLRNSSDSHKAYLQLALIYEDHYQNLPQAIIHYKTYLSQSIDQNDIEIGEKWLTRAGTKIL